MRLNLLHFDEALMRQPNFRSACARNGSTECDLREVGARIRLWGGRDDLAELKETLRASLQGLDDDQTVVTWMGSGDFHHVTALLLDLLAERHGPITVVQFDNHPDWVRHAVGLHCGSWARAVLDDGLAERVITIGAASRDLVWPDLKGAGLDHIGAGRHVLFPLRPIRISAAGRGLRRDNPRIRALCERSGCIEPVFDAELAADVLGAIATDAVYVTIDKDVLCAETLATNWDQGSLGLEDLVGWLALLLATRDVVGIDVVGDYSAPAYAGSWLTRLRKRAETAIDQPRATRRSMDPRPNERTNLRLLEVLEAARC